jgi:hypothetical protein
MTDSDQSKSAGVLVTEFLRDRDVACPTCLYNLRGVEGDRCPECGSPLRLEVAGSISGAFLWLSALLGTSVGTLIALVSLLAALRDVWRLLDDPQRALRVQAGVMSATELPRWPSVIALTAVLSLLSFALAWLLTSRRRFGRLAPFWRITLGVTAGLGPLIVIGLLRVIIVWT